MLRQTAPEEVPNLQHSIANLDLSNCFAPQHAMHTFIAHFRRKGVPLKAATQAWACHRSVMARKEKKTLRNKLIQKSEQLLALGEKPK